MIRPSIPLLYLPAEARSPRVPDPGPAPVPRRDVVRRAPGVRGVGRVAARERGRRQRRLGPRGEPRRRAIDVSPRASDSGSVRFGAAAATPCAAPLAPSVAGRRRRRRRTLRRLDHVVRGVDLAARAASGS